ncbi:MAG: T9SS type A sorting domain-containing protein [Bacteroidota bacterium]
MKYIFIAILIFVIPFPNYGNNSWYALGGGLNNYVQSIYIDSTDSKVYAGGPFSQADSLRAIGITVWDGSNWDSLGNGLLYSQYNFTITKYQNQIYSDGGFVWHNPYQHGGKFNGTNWDTLGNGSLGFIHKFHEFNGNLWASGDFIDLANDTCSVLSYWDGTDWHCLNAPYFGHIDDFTFFNGQLIIAGNFFDSVSRVGIAYFDGSQFQIMGHRIGGGFGNVHSIAVYRGELYIGGYFTQVEGNEGNHIMKWNGIGWEDVGGGMDSWIQCMSVYNDELYVGGAFTYAGGVLTGNLAKWNGTQWAAVTPSVISPIIYDLQFFNGELYIGGGFAYVDTIQVNYIAKYSGPLSVSDFSKSSLDYYLAPNPSNYLLSVSFSSRLMQDAILTTSDAIGCEQFRVFIPSQTIRKEIDIRELASGIYFVTLENEIGSVTKKFIKQ